MTASMSHTLTAITFSDSVFVATTYFFEAANFATSLIQSMLCQQIPLRIGIGFGSFAALSFRSEISVNAGAKIDRVTPREWGDAAEEN
jgi:hypothetical protein